MDYIEIGFTVSSEETKNILTALLNDAGYEGFEEGADFLQAFIPADRFDENDISEIAGRLGMKYSRKQIADRNWNALWESNFQPVQVDDFCLIRADFHAPGQGVRHEIIITPKMSFGTGHHATTYMMIRQMQELDLKNKNVLDFGTGTGILAILAYQCGARHITAIDNDDWSIENADENIGKNGATVKLIKADTASGAESFDIILANITRNVITDNFDHFIMQLQTGGTLLLSGLLEDDEAHMMNLADQYHLRLKKKMAHNGWISVAFIK